MLARKSLRTIVIIPTYNERENIVRLCKKVLSQGNSLDVLVVDDDSPDGTGEVVQKETENNTRINLLSRSGKQGLGTAHIAGYLWGFKRGYDRIVTMDADFSHPPERIPAMIKLSRSCEVVIGSRYIQGGGYEDWPLHRIFLSAASNWVARTFLRLTPRDCTGAFRCFQTGALREIPLENIRATGYDFQEEMLWQCSGRGWDIGEVPITFAQREAGSSKINLGEIVRAAWTVLRLVFTPDGERRK
ncbi:MAG: polyprenol monophosphomannose synthase [Planctomycetes bacterium]|nr:polyprenol monophosphomannose synthase [Planctomycetota bacterium]